MAAYEGNRASAVEEVVESDQVATAVRSLADEGPWQGTCTELLEELRSKVGDTAARVRSWPATARILSGQLRRVAPALRRLGVNVEFLRNGKTRTVKVSAAPVETCHNSASLPSSASSGDVSDSNSTISAATQSVTQSRLVEDSASPLASSPNPLKTSPGDASDGDDESSRSTDWPDAVVEL